MEKISIKLEQPYFCLQNGFEWNNIPNLAVITGINGAGKSHLIRLLTSTASKQGNSPQLNVVNAATASNVVLVAPTSINDKSIDGLIGYFKNTEYRLGRIAANQQNIAQSTQFIERIENQLRSVTDIGQKANFNRQIHDQQNTISRWRNEIENLTIYEYEQELDVVVSKLQKNCIELTEDEVRDNASPIFNSLTDIPDFTKYIQQNEAYKDKLRIKYSKALDFKRSKELESEKKIYQLINELFVKFGFDYYVMKDPYEKDDNWDGKLLFLGKNSEVIEYDRLSSGEQMIVKFVIWAMGKDERGKRINTMLLDEPDAHLHPKMSRMMIEILQEISNPKSKGGSGIRVILTTHSPSTVAFTPQESLFVLEKDEHGNRHIKSTNTKNAIHILSEGIFTFDKAIDSFQLIANSQKQLIVCTEGKTDVMHIKTAMQKLNRNLDIDVIDVHDAGALCNFIKSTPSTLFGGKKVVALFDNDGEGQKCYRSINGEEVASHKKLTAVQCGGKSFATLIPLPDAKLGKYCPIEFLYSKTILTQENVIEKRNYKDFSNSYEPPTSQDAKALVEEYDTENTLRPFKVKDTIKNQFAGKVQEFEAQEFKDFTPLLDIFEAIINA